MKIRFFCIISSFIFCHQAAAYDVLVNINGEIASNGCIVSAASQQITLDFGNVSIKQFYASGIHFLKRPLVISLEKCGHNATAVKVSFQGAPDSKNSKLLQLTQGPGVAMGLAIEILDMNRDIVPINTQTSALTINHLAPNNDLLFYAQYRSTAITVTPGTANATANFVLEYQ